MANAHRVVLVVFIVFVTGGIIVVEKVVDVVAVGAAAVVDDDGVVGSRLLLGVPFCHHHRCVWVVGIRILNYTAICCLTLCYSCLSPFHNPQLCYQPGSTLWNLESVVVLLVLT